MASPTITSSHPKLRDKWWRLTNLYKIRDKYGRLITFEPNEVQLNILSTSNEALRQKYLKYRQGGVTSLFCIDELDDALWIPGMSCGIIAHDRSTLDKIFWIVKRAQDNLPEWLKPVARQDTLRSYKFERMFDGTPLDSEIYVDMKIRGGTVQRLHISERAYIEGADSQELEAGSKQAVPMYGRITEETTGNGYNEFYDGFMEAWENETPGVLEERAYFFAWHEHSEYTLPSEVGELTADDLKLKEIVRKAYNKELTDGQIIWYRWKKKELMKASLKDPDKIGLRGDQLMKQEYPSTILEAFQSGLGNVFDVEKLGELIPIEPAEVRENGFKIWHKPEPDKLYVIGSDPSDGVGSDKAAIAVWDTNMRKCAEWAGQRRPDEQAEIIKDIATEYNHAFAGVENNQIAVITFLVKIYDNYFITVTVDEKRDRRTKKIGWTTTGKSRDIMIDEFRMHFDEDSLDFDSALTMSEMKTFVKKANDKREHAEGKADDMLIADMIAIQMIKHFKQKTKRRVFAKPAGL